MEILNDSKEGNVESKMTFISKVGASVIDRILYTYDIAGCLRTFKVRDMISDHSIRETVIEVEGGNKDMMAHKMNEYGRKQLKTYK